MNPFENIYNHILPIVQSELDRLASLKEINLAEAMNQLVSGKIVMAAIDSILGNRSFFGEFRINNNRLERKAKNDSCWEVYHCPINTVFGFHWYERKIDD